MPRLRIRKTTWLAFIVFDLLVAAWLIWLFLLRAQVSSLNELGEMGVTRYPEPLPIERFVLLDHKEGRFTEQDLLGTWSLVFFGFTSCPDICPLTMGEMAQFYRQAKQSDPAAAPQVLFISVDPARDGVAELAAYMARFDQEFIGLSGSPRDIARVAANFHVAYREDHEGHLPTGSVTDLSRQNGDYTVSHSAHVMLVNPAGRLEAVIRPPIRSETMARVYPQLVGESR